MPPRCRSSTKNKKNIVLPPRKFSEDLQVVQVMAERAGVSLFTAADRNRISSAWHRLSAWPDFGGPLKASRRETRP